MRVVVFLLACYVTVVGTLLLITIVMLVSDAVAAPGLARDVIAATAGQLVALSGSAWLERCASRRTGQVRAARSDLSREH